MDKMKRVFSLVLVLAMLVGSFSSFSTIAFAEETKAEEVKVEEVKKEETEVKAEEAKEEKKEEAQKEAEVLADNTKVLSNVPTDVIGTPYEEAVARLVAFGVIGGYPDGTYKPEEEINRAQFSKIVVMALGLNDAVPAAANRSTGFKDVQPGYWAAGYINVASGQGLLKGYPDGTFKPANKVSYAEALTILVRTLGYQDEFLPGNWPGNYVAKAADLKITSGVEMPSNATEGAKRGPVAQMVDNTFDAKVVKVEKFKPNTKEVEYYETDITLLKDRLDISKYEDVRIFADKIVDDGLSKDEVSVRFLEKTTNKDEVKTVYDKNETKEFKSDINARPFIGEEITLYLTNKDRVIFAESEKEDKAHFDYVEEIKGDDKVKLVEFDKEYSFEEKADVYIFNTKNKSYDYYEGRDLEDKDIEEMVQRNGKFVVKNNKVVYAEVQNSDEAFPFMVVLENDKDVLTGVKEEADDYKLDLAKDKDYDYTLVFDTNGNQLEVKDIEKGNVVYAQLQDYDGDDVAVVTVVLNNKVTGEIGSYRDDRVEIGGKTYKAIKYVDNKDTKGYETYYSVSDLDDIKKWDPTDGTDFEKDFDDAYKEEVTAYLTATGRIAFLSTSVDGTSGYKYGVVTRTYADNDRVRIYTSIDGKEGKDHVFKADKDKNLTQPEFIKFKNDGKYETVSYEDFSGDKNILGKAVKFRINKDGEISKDEFYVMDKDSVFVMEKDKDFGKDSMRLTLADIDGKDDINEVKVGSKNQAFSASNSLSIVSAEGLNPLDPKFTGKNDGNIEDLQTIPNSNLDIDDFDIAKWEDIKEDNYDPALRMYVFPKGNKYNEADAVIFVGKDGASTGSDEVALYVTKKDRKDGDNLVDFDEYGLGTEKQVVVDGDKSYSSVEKERAYVAKHKANGKIQLLEDNYGFKDFTIYRDVKVTKVTGSEVTIESTSDTKIDGASKSLHKTNFVTKGSPVIYFEDRPNNLRAGQLVDMIVEDDVNVRVVGIHDQGKGGSGSGSESTTKGDITYLNSSDKKEVTKLELKVSESVTLDVMYKNQGKEDIVLPANSVIARAILKDDGTVAIDGKSGNSETILAAGATTKLGSIVLTVGTNTNELEPGKDYTVKSYVAGKDLSVDLPVRVLSDNKTVKEVHVNDVKATGTATSYTVTLPFGTDLTKVKASDIVVTPNDKKAEVGVAKTTNGGATWTVEITAEDKTTEDITINVSVAAASKNAGVDYYTIEGNNYASTNKTVNTSGSHTDSITLIGAANLPSSIKVVTTDKTATVSNLVETGTAGVWTFTVTAQDSTVVVTYTVTITK